MKANISVTLLLIFVCCVSVSAQTTEFTYQGRLTDTGGTAASYDFEFKLFSAPNDIVVLGTQTRLGVPVSGNVFTVQLDFGGQFDGTARYLEIGVKPAGSGGAFTALTPRQPITSAPYAVRSLNAATALNSTELGGVAANQFVQTGDTRLTDARNPLAGSPNYIQNATGLQAASNFNISGIGTANILNATTQLNIFGFRAFIAIPNTDNLFAGFSAGRDNNNFGIANTFIGSTAGRANTSGGFNTFVGASSGLSNTTSEYNTFLGASAGRFNTTGSNNTFVGVEAGANTSTGQNNSFFGRSAGGECNSFTPCPNPQTGANNSFFGFETGFSSTTGENNSFYGKSAGRFNTTGSRNSFFGVEAGRDAVTTSSNSFFGYAAGQANTGVNNSFFGTNAGRENTGGLNSFFGISSGANNSSGSRNSFFGANAGDSNSTAERNSFFGNASGISNTTGTRNSFFGDNAGLFNDTGIDNSFFGQQAGQNTTTGDNNVIVGSNAGIANTIGSNNTLIGRSSNVGANNLTFATAIGAGAVVSASNTIALGRAAGSDGVRIAGNLTIGILGTAIGAVPICRNVGDFVSTCGSSSLRYKTNIGNFNPGLDIVKRLRPITFDWKEGGMHDFGLGAEDVAAVEPLLATYNKDGQIEGVKYDRIGVVLLNAVKEQQATIEEQHKKIASLVNAVCKIDPASEICTTKEQPK